MIEWILLASLPAVALSVTLFNLLSWRRGVDVPSNAEVEVLIPARNEARNIVDAIDSVLEESVGHQGRVRITVCDDGSKDGTRELIEEHYRSREEVRLLEGKGLPSGWVGKPFACQQLLENAEGELLLYMDADVRLEPGGLGRLLSLLEGAPHARVVTAVPRQISVGAFERLVMPLLILTYTSWLPLRLVEWGRDDRTVAANGQLLMMRRNDCERLGGFESIKHEIVDDVAFCRLAKRSGLKVVFADGFLIARCRMYDSAASVFQGFSKNMYEGIGGSVISLVLVTALYLGAFVVPYVALALGLTLFPSLFFPAAAAVVFNLLLRACLAVRFRQPLEGVLTHPAGVLALVAILFNSFRWSIRGRSEWAGRNYSSRKTRQLEGAFPTTSVDTLPKQGETV